jgi:hypothetical protein
VHVGRYRYRIGARMREILEFLRDEGPAPRSLLVEVLRWGGISRQAAHQAVNRALAQGLVVVDGDEVALHPRLRRPGGAGGRGA